MSFWEKFESSSVIESIGSITLSNSKNEVPNFKKFQEKEDKDKNDAEKLLENIEFPEKAIKEYFKTVFWDIDYNSLDNEWKITDLTEFIISQVKSLWWEISYEWEDMMWSIRWSGDFQVKAIYKWWIETYSKPKLLHCISQLWHIGIDFAMTSLVSDYTTYSQNNKEFLFWSKDEYINALKLTILLEKKFDSNSNLIEPLLRQYKWFKLCMDKITAKNFEINKDTKITSENWKVKLTTSEKEIILN